VKLCYSHSGRQFFFITLTTVGRAKVFSQLVDEATRPRLSAIGEVVKAALLALRRVNAAVTVSDFVIMPDHLHFIMIVDYGRDRRVSPLFLSHRLVDAVEGYVEWTGLRPEPRSVAEIGPEPRSVAEIGPEPRGVAKIGPEPRGVAEGGNGEHLVETMVRLIRAAIANVKASPSKPLPHTSAIVSNTSKPPPCTSKPSPHTAVFDRSCYIELSFDSRQLKATRRYIKLNPARALWKLRHPDRFRRIAIPVEKLLGPHPSAPWGSGRCPVQFHALGDLSLLGSPFFFHVRLTLKKSLAEHEAAIAEIVVDARRGRIPVSGFISPGEREALRRLKATPGVRFIKLLPHALPPRYDPSAEDSREIADGRMLLLSGFPDTPAISSLEMRRSSAASHAFRQNCLAMNDLAAALCSRG